MKIFYITVKEVSSINKLLNDKHKIKLSPQLTGYGQKHFLVCPSCALRRARLYLSTDPSKKGFVCRKCYPGGIYGDMTNQDAGSPKNIRYRMERLCVQIGVTPEYPFNPWSPSLEKPDSISWAKWGKFIRRMTILENMRIQSKGASALGIPKKRYSAKTIKYYMDEIMNIDLDLYQLKQIRDWNEHVPE